MNTLSILLALTTALCWGTSNAMMKVPSLSIGSSRAIFLRQLSIVAVLFVPFLFFFKMEFLNWILISIGLGLYGYLPFFFFCQAISIAPVGIISAISNAYPLLVCLLSYYYLNVELSSHKLVGVVLAAVGVFILTVFRIDRSRKKEEVDFKNSSRAIILSLLACVLWGVFFTAVQVPNKKIGIVSFIFCAQLGTLISSALHAAYGERRRTIGRKSLKIGVKAGMIALVGSLSFYQALLIGNPSAVTAVASCSPIAGAIFGIYFYKEKFRIPQWVGVILSVIGIGLLR